MIKLGGALLAADELRDWLAACSAPSSSVRCVVVTGGGALADEVRALQARWRFDDRVAHELALDTMRLNARVLQALAPGLALWSTPSNEQAPASRPEGNCLWMPPPDFAPAELPMSWAVTSDSIALWLARRVGAQALLLVKSLSPSALHAAANAGLAAQGVVDDYFSTLLAPGGVALRVTSKLCVEEFIERRRQARLPGAGIERV
ncbi:MAG: hypothetical protein IPG43_20720 [Proteobacteria bacterium]|nr:hypothetical protein [Pseudomonadota bacterium]